MTLETQIFASKPKTLFSLSQAFCQTLWGWFLLAYLRMRYRSANIDKKYKKWDIEVQSFVIGYWVHCFFIKEFQKWWNRLKDWVMNFIILFKKKIKIMKRERPDEWAGRYSNWLSLLPTEKGNNNVRIWRNRTGQQIEEATTTFYCGKYPSNSQVDNRKLFEE